VRQRIKDFRKQRIKAAAEPRCSKNVVRGSRARSEIPYAFVNFQSSSLLPAVNFDDEAVSPRR